MSDRSDSESAERNRPLDELEYLVEKLIDRRTITTEDINRACGVILEARENHASRRKCDAVDDSFETLSAGDDDRDDQC